MKNFKNDKLTIIFFKIGKKQIINDRQKFNNNNTKC